jgi:hypothetical protein
MCCENDWFYNFQLPHIIQYKGFRVPVMRLYNANDFLAVARLSSQSISWRAAVLVDMKRKSRRILAKQLKKAARQKPRNRHRNRGFAVGEMEYLSDRQYKEMFRVDRSAFDWLVEDLDTFLRRNEVKANNSSGSCIPTSTKLAVTLRWLAGGSHIDLCFAWGISKTSFFSERGVLWPTIEALNDLLPDISFPMDDTFQLDEMAEGFNKRNNNVMNGLVLVVDGLIVRTRRPTHREVPDPKSYVHRKGGFGVLVMAGCDARTKFRSLTAKNTGSTNDNTAWDNSALGDALSQGLLPKQYFIGGDEAFTCTDSFVSPWSGRGLGVWKDSFNYWLSHSRQTIERAFGILVARWGIYWRKFRFSYNRWSLVIAVTMKLHNMCVDRADEVPIRRFHEDYRVGDRSVVMDNSRDDDVDFRRRTYAGRRQNLTASLQTSGTGRPQHAWVNRRID